jgi:hypothetical protein
MPRDAGGAFVAFRSRSPPVSRGRCPPRSPVRMSVAPRFGCPFYARNASAYPLYSSSWKLPPASRAGFTRRSSRGHSDETFTDATPGCGRCLQSPLRHCRPRICDGATPIRDARARAAPPLGRVPGLPRCRTGNGCRRTRATCCPPRRAPRSSRARSGMHP